MSPIRCADCERNVSLEIGETEIEETRLNDSSLGVEIDIHMYFTCTECGADLAECTATSEEIVPKLEDYLEKHEELDVNDSDLDEAEITEVKIITRGGRKTYLAKWATQLKLNKKTFKVAGELAVTQDQFELLN